MRAVISNDGRLGIERKCAEVFEAGCQRPGIMMEISGIRVKFINRFKTSPFSQVSEMGGVV
jgi:hypothetical protein